GALVARHHRPRRDPVHVSRRLRSVGLVGATRPGAGPVVRPGGGRRLRVEIHVLLAAADSPPPARGPVRAARAALLPVPGRADGYPGCAGGAPGPSQGRALRRDPDRRSRADHLSVEGEYRSASSPAGLSIPVPRRRTTPGAAGRGGSGAPTLGGLGDRLGGPRLPGVERGRGGD